MPRIRDDIAHGWDLSAEEAADLQRQLAEHVVIEPLPVEGDGAPDCAAGVDVGYSRDGEQAWACAVVVDRGYRVIDRAIVPGVPDRDYETGLLAFREGRLSVEALCSLHVEPDLVFCDGHGVVHERGLGLASHVGVLLDLPVIGVPKTPFHAVERLPEPARGSTLVYTKEWGAQGAALRLRSHSKPVYVSPGHRTDLESAIALCLAWSSGRHRVPEPLQRADTLSKMARNEARPR
jgi:deoxyribonuclease V